MNRGFFLSLLVGPVLAKAAPQVVIDNLTNAQVTTTAEPCTPSGFQLSFSLTNRSPLQTFFLLAGGSIAPVLRVILVVTVDGTPEVLIDGVVTRQDVSPGAAKGASTLTVTGLDLTAVMNLIPFDGFAFPGMPPEARVASMIAKYAAFGIVPLVIPSVLVDVPIPDREIPRQQGTDLEYIQKLADDVGYVFYLKPGPSAGRSVAYWGPDIKVGAPQKALSVDLDAHTNVESLRFSFDAESAVQPVVLVQEPQSKAAITIPLPDITPLNPPLGLLPPPPKRIEFFEGSAKYGPTRAALVALARAARSADAVSGTGSLDVLRYGRPLRARELVGVRGAGTAFDGLYYVASVTHKIQRGEYKQEFKLTRNGLLPTVSTVPV